MHGRGYMGRGIVPTPLTLLSAQGQMSESDLVTVDLWIFFLLFPQCFFCFLPFNGEKCIRTSCD